MFNKKFIFLLVIVLCCCSFITIYTIFKSTRTVDSYASTIKKSTPKAQLITNAKTCTSALPLENLTTATDSHLRKLNEYQIICKSFATNKIMIFTDMPNSDMAASESAASMAALLQEFSKNNITPVVIVEPSTSWGLIDFMEFESGFYDKWISTYFKTLQSYGLSDSQMGIWVPFSEANAPLWNKGDATPKDFALDVNKYLEIMKSYFPTAHASILLNAASYDNNDTDWANGKYVSLLPYVKDINKNLVDSFGLQGFPWEPQNGSKTKPLNNPAQFINTKLAIEAAKQLNVKEIWFNTGTFASKYTQDPDKMITVPVHTRQNILNNIVQQAQNTKAQGYTVWINLFAENKSNTSEQTDWSYWHNVNQYNTPEQQILKNFLAELQKAGIGLSIYDNYENTGQPIQ